MGFWLLRNNSKRELVELIENFNLNDFCLFVLVLHFFFHLGLCRETL